MDKKVVIKTGGKQYLAGVGDTLSIERLPAPVGETVTFSEILLVMDGDEITLGQPLVTGRTVIATVAKVGRLKKVTGSKFKNKTRYTRHLGHRQQFTQVRITGIK